MRTTSTPLSAGIIYDPDSGFKLAVFAIFPAEKTPIKGALSVFSDTGNCSALIVIMLIMVLLNPRENDYMRDPSILPRDDSDKSLYSGFKIVLL